MELAFSNFGEVISVFKGRHKFNRKIRNGKRHVRIFPAGGDPAIMPGKISFQGGVSRDVLFAEEVLLCYRCKTRHMLGENRPVASPTLEGSDMSCSEQNETSQDPPSAGSQQKSSVSEERSDGCSSAEDPGDDFSSESTSTPGDDDDSERVSSVPETPLQKPVASTPQKNPENQTNHPNTSTRHNQTNQRTIRSLRTLKQFDQKPAMFRNEINFFREILIELNHRDIEYRAKILTWTAELLYCKKREKTYVKTLIMYTRRYALDKKLDPGSTPAVFDDMMYSLVDEIWSYYLSKWRK